MDFPVSVPTRPGRATPVSPGYGSEANPLLVPRESRDAWALGPPPSTKFSMMRKLGIARPTRMPSAAAVPVNEPAGPGTGAGSARAGAPAGLGAGATAVAP